MSNRLQHSNLQPVPPGLTGILTPRQRQLAGGRDGSSLVNHVVPCPEKNMGAAEMDTRLAHKGLCSLSRDEFNRRARAALNAFMLASNLTNKHVANALGVHENTVSNWRSGTEIPAYMIAQICVLFGAPMWAAIYHDFGHAMRKRYERIVAAEQQALHDWSFMTQDTGT